MVCAFCVVWISLPLDRKTARLLQQLWDSVLQGCRLFLQYQTWFCDINDFFLNEWVCMKSMYLNYVWFMGCKKLMLLQFFVGVQVSKCNSVESAPYLVQEDNCRWCTCSIRALRFIESLWRTKLGRCICIWCLWRNSWCYCTASGAQGMVCIRLVSKHSSIILLNLVDPGIFTWYVLDLQLMS